MCKGPCQVLFYDYSYDLAKTTVVPDKDNKGWCTGHSLSADEMKSAIEELEAQMSALPYFVKVGCEKEEGEEEECVCDLFPDQKPTWTDGHEYQISTEVISFIDGDINKPCHFFVWLTYKRSTLVEDGICKKKPDGWTGYPRRQKPAPTWWGRLWSFLKKLAG